MKWTVKYSLYILLVVFLSGCSYAQIAKPTDTNTPAPTSLPLQAYTLEPSYSQTPISTGTPTHVPTPANSPTPYRNLYFVDALKGLDSNNGSINTPWRTLQKAADMALAGDTVYLRGGTYNERVLMRLHSGTPDAYITFMAYPGETPVIDGTGMTIAGNAGLIDIRNVNYIRINELTTINSDVNGVFANYVIGIEVSDMHTKNTHGPGIGIWRSDQILVTRNTVVNACNALQPTGYDESITIAVDTNFEVSYNDISINGGIRSGGNNGIDAKDGSRFGKIHHNYVHDMPINNGGIYVDGWEHLTGNIDIYSNHIVNVAWGITIGSERTGTVENVRVYNNLIYRTATGIGIGHAWAPGLKRNIEIYNNTIYKATGKYYAGIHVAATNIENIVIRNNVVYFNSPNGEITADSAFSLPNIKANNNLVFEPNICLLAYSDCVEISTNPPGYPDIYGNITADPMFVSLTLPDLHLLPNSPAIDSGASINSLITDYDGNIRPQGIGSDIGAYEVFVIKNNIK
jgi:hypothetical protein